MKHLRKFESFNSSKYYQNGKFVEPEEGSGEWYDIADEAQAYYAEGSDAKQAAQQMNIPLKYMRKIFRYLREEQ